MVTEQQASEDEGIRGLHEANSSLWYRNTIDVKHILNYSSENDAVMESPTDQETIQGIMDTPTNDDYNPNDSCVLPNVSPKKAFH